jgi:protein O-mannosyl-transferase
MNQPETSIAVSACSAVIATPAITDPRRVRPSILFAAVLIVPVAAFLPALWNGFVWDDSFNFLGNYEYRGLGWHQVRWMLTTTLLSHWIPVTWLTLGFDYVVWGMNPAGYHLTNLVLHAANAALFWLVAARVIHLATPRTCQTAVLTGATAASLFFSIHPLRVESVAWITERRDVLSGLFFLLAVLAYLRAHDRQGGKTQPWLAISVACFQFGVLSKSIVVTLPVVLLLLDVYPLRRLEPGPTRWSGATNRRVLLEKLPFLPMAAMGGFVATTVIGRVHEFTPLSAVERLTIAFYSVGFYPLKTILPLGLSPLYELPQNVDPRQLQFALSITLVIGLTVLLLSLARRWPAGVVAWLVYVVIVAPVSGISHTGVQITADRYSYLSCLPWAVLFGGGVSLLVRAATSVTPVPLQVRFGAVAVVTWLAVLAVMTSQQAMVWRDAETLWSHAVIADPRCYLCRHNLGGAELTAGNTASAISHLERAVALRPPAPLSRGALVFAYLAAGAPAQAQEQLDAIRRVDADLARDLSALFVTRW